MENSAKRAFSFASVQSGCRMDLVITHAAEPRKQITDKPSELWTTAKSVTDVLLIISPHILFWKYGISGRIN